MRRKIRILTFFLFTIIIFTFNTAIIYAGQWHKGTLHQHTSFSTWNGYDNIDDGSSDECDEPLEGFSRWPFKHEKNDGRNISTLRIVAD